MSFRRVRLSLLAVSVAGVVVIAAACGGSSSASPPVASTASGTTTPPTTTATGPSTSSGTPGGGGNQFVLSMQVPLGAAGRKFSVCMRSHGIPAFPDPNGQGVIRITGGPGSAIDPGSPEFQSAQQTCRKLLPHGGQASPAQIAATKRQLLAYSACMRTHGVPDYPDPTFSGNSVQMKISGAAGSGLDPGLPKFQSAQQACKGDLPGKASGVLTQHAGPK